MNRVFGYKPILVVFLCLAGACTQSAGPKASGIVSITATDTTLDAFDDMTQLTAEERNHRNEPLRPSRIDWSSSDPAIASVTSYGLVTAHGNGTATITARSARGLVGNLQIVVQQVPVSIVVTPEDWPAAQAWIGARRQFTAAVADGNGYPIEDDSLVSWTSSSPGDVHVTDSGFATAMSTGTDVLLTAEAGAVSDSIIVTVVGDGSNGPGTMYTIWFPRSDDAPAVLSNGRIFVPDEVIASIARTDPAPPWPHSRPTVQKFQWEGDRIGILTDVADGSGTFRVRDRIGEWVNLVVADALDFQLENNRIAVLQRGGLLRARDGTSGAWTVLVPAGAARFKLYGSRIGVVMDDGEFRVKDGLDDPWTVQVAAGGAPRFQLYANRIGVLLADGTLRVKDGINGAWTEIGSGVADFEIYGNRIAVLQQDDVFRVQDGPAGDSTVLSTEPLAQFDLQGDRIGIRLESGLFRVKDGIHGAWTDLADGDVREFQLQGNLIGMIRDSDGALLVRFGPNDTWNPNPPVYGPNVTQFRLVVDVPSPPYRTTPASYADEQARCAAIGEDAEPDVNDCYTVPNFAIPVAYYGMFCGGGRPHDFSAAITAGAIDSFDHLCWHHDMVESWYPETPNDASDDGGACIVRYGLRHGRLTRNGDVLTHGYESSEDWEDGWAGAGMVNLKDALDDYFIYTAVCSEAELAEFTGWTAARH